MRDRMIAPGHDELRVARADRGDPVWDSFVRHAPGSSFCHMAGWGGIVEDVLGREYVPLVAVTRDGDWEGVLPLVRVRTPLLGHSLISMPYLNYGGPIGTPDACRRLVEAALLEMQLSGADSLQLRCRQPLVPAEAADVHKIMVLLDLPDSVEALWSSFPGKLRSQIRRPQKEGMEFRTGPAELEPFYDVFARNMRDLGTPVYARTFFESMARTFDNVVFAAVYWRGRAIGGACGFIWDDEFEITWASCIRDYNSKSPNMLLYWGLMQAMIARGVKVFNFGRSTPGTGPHRFKAQWGGTDVPLPWLGWSRRGSTSSGGPGGAARLASAAWQRLPLAVANRIGPPLACRLPWW
jgi:serine/alanine adding enzyme